jgi:hypothetical protein
MRRNRGLAPVISGALFGLAFIAAGAAPAQADDLKIRSPIIESHELEWENNFTIGQRKTAVSEIEYGFTDWLKLGLEGEWAADPGHGFHYDAAAVEGFVQLTPQGKYWADLGLFAEYEHTARRGDPRSITIGPLVQKETPFFGGLSALHTLNVLFTKELGEASSGTPSLFLAAQSRVRLDPHFEPGIEYYGSRSLGSRGEDPEHRLGPAFAGRVGFREFGINAPGGIRYDAAYLRGLNANTDRNTGRVRFELEFPL